MFYDLCVDIRRSLDQHGGGGLVDDAPFPLANKIKVVDTTQYKPTIFHCHTKGNGFAEAQKIFQMALPEYEFVHNPIQRYGDKPVFVSKSKQEGRNNEWDFFLMPLGKVCNNQIASWLMDDFQGNSIYISGESIGGYMPHRMTDKFLIGPTPDGDRTMTLTYLQMTWYQVFRPLYQNSTSGNAESVLVDASKRPRGKPTKKFLIYAASNCVGYRQEAFLALSTIGPANYGGKCAGPSGGDWTNRTKADNNINLGNWWDNVNFYGGFRFCLVMEHANEPEYVTEKIVMAFLGGCIPIYYGPQLIFEFFNPEAFVFYDVDNPQPAMDLVRKLEADPEEYEQMIGKPILARGEQTVADWFSFQDDIGGGKLKTKIRNLLLGSFEFVNHTTDTRP